MSTIAVPATPELANTGPGVGRISDAPALILSWAEFTCYARDLKRSSGCTRPIRIKGHLDAIDLASGERRPMYDTASEPGGVLLMPCGNRRESVCPPCSQVYKRDARQLVRAGLTGGKGVPETVAGHPCVFATFTAPSFGPVHSRRMRGKTVLPCRPRRDHKERRCPHGRDISCPRRHNEDDPRLGRPLCPDCYDYAAAVLFNLHAADLWRRFTTYLPRKLAALAGLTQRQLRAIVRVRYVKVAEYQARGVIHFHAVIRLDAPGEDYQPPPKRFTADLLADAIVQAAAAVRRTVGPDGDHPDYPALTLRFGGQVDPRPIRPASGGLPGTGRKLSVEAVSNYIAKYATKTLEVPGLPSRPPQTRFDIDSLRCSRHHKQMIATAWDLAAHHATGNPRLRKAAHALGWAGHFLTKSRRYSTTFGHLRRARAEHRKRQRHPDGERDPWGRPLDDTVVLVLKTWAYDGTGYATTAGAELALASAALARDQERSA
jgi:replication initiator protein RepSA